MMGAIDVAKNLNLAVRFLLEIGVLAALGYWGVTLDRAGVVRLGAGLGVPLLAALVWACFGAPKAPFALEGLPLLALEVVVFGSALFALFLADRFGLAAAFLLIFLVNRALMGIWGQ